MLKDSLIIMLLVYAFTNQNFVRAIMVPVLALFRLASILYFSIFFKRKYILWGGVLALLIWAILGEVITNQILYFNSSSMQLRAFDTVPNFQNFGLMGAILRAILWPIFALSGAFVFLSPAPAYMMVAIGIYFGLAYTLLMIGRGKSSACGLWCDDVVRVNGNRLCLLFEICLPNFGSNTIDCHTSGSCN